MFPRYGAHQGASPTVCFAAPPLDVCGFAAWRCAPNPLMDTFARPAEGAEDQKPHQKPHQKPKPKPKPKQIKRSQPSAVPAWHWMHSVRNWSAGRPPSRASPLPQWIGVGSWRLVGWSAAIAGRPAPTIGPGASARDWSAVRPPSPAGWLLQFRERATLRRSRPTQHNER